MKPRWTVLPPLLLLALGAALTVSASTTNPVFVWANSNSLANAKASGNIVSEAELSGLIRATLERHAGDVLLLVDRTNMAGKMGDLISTSHPAVSPLKLTLLKAGSRVVLPYVNAGNNVETFLSELVKSVKNLDVSYIKSAHDVELVQRSDKHTLFVVDVMQFGSVGSTLAALETKFGEGSAPFVAIYAGEPSSASARPRRVSLESALIVEDAVINNGTTNPMLRIFDYYTFVNEAIWMGLLTVIILVMILILGFNGLASLQTPSQFEKKPLATS